LDKTLILQKKLRIYKKISEFTKKTANIQKNLHFETLFLFTHLRLAQKVDKGCECLNKKDLNVLIQIRTSDEDSKIFLLCFENKK